MSKITSKKVVLWWRETEVKYQINKYISINGKCYGKIKRLEVLERGTNESTRVEFYLFFNGVAF